MKLRHFDVCSGIGGFALGFRWAALSEPVAFCEIDEYCQKVLAKNFPNIPIFNDVKELVNEKTKPESTRTIPDHDILTSGYPCQPFSVAGKRRGEEDPRNIWPYVYEIVKRKHPTWCVFENVYGHVAMGLDKVLNEMEMEGYTTQTFIVPACSLDAPHLRNRLWIVAHSNRQSESTSTKHGGEGQGKLGSMADTPSTGLERQSEHSPSISCSGEKRSESRSETSRENAMADTQCMGREPRSEEREEFTGEESHGESDHRSSNGSEEERARNWWQFEPNVGRVAYGVSSRVDRLRGLGNAIVPQIAMQIGLSIKEAINVQSNGTNM
jgi:DNA (cytosine-5)-methyltransferase 1